jgi:PilZ domain
MPGLALAMTADRESVVQRAKAERRHFLRVRVELSGRLFAPASNREAVCKVIDLSPGGAQIASEFVPAPQEAVILYIDGFGRFEGNVVRPPDGIGSGGVFGVSFHCSALKREKIAEQLTLYMNRELVDESIVRRHGRTSTKDLAHFTRANGEIVDCEVLDLSLGGVSLKTNARPPMGEIILIGHIAGRVVRYHETGVAIEFVTSHSEKSGPESPANPFTVVG